MIFEFKYCYMFLLIYKIEKFGNIVILQLWCMYNEENIFFFFYRL